MALRSTHTAFAAHILVLKMMQGIIAEIGRALGEALLLAPDQVPRGHVAHTTMFFVVAGFLVSDDCAHHVLEVA